MPTFGVLLSGNNARRQRQALEYVRCVLLERTLFDPPRAGAAKRWGTAIRRIFPNAEIVPYVWHLVTHSADDGLRGLGSRALEGAAHLFGGLQPSKEVAQAWQAICPAFEALGARRIVLRTPASITPGAVGRARIKAFVEGRRAEGFEILWEPEGLWSPQEAGAFADALNIDLLGPAFVAGRPNVDEPGSHTLFRTRAYLRVDGRGRRPRLAASQLDALLDHTELEPNSTFVFSGPKALANLAATAALLQG